MSKKICFLIIVIIICSGILVSYAQDKLDSNDQQLELKKLQEDNNDLRLQISSLNDIIDLKDKKIGKLLSEQDEGINKVIFYEKEWTKYQMNFFTYNQANHIKECISTHSNRNACSIEVKIVFDADKLDIMGL